MADSRDVLRGDIYWAYLDPVFGREQGGFEPRPCVVLSINDIHRKQWGLATVVPGTTSRYPPGKNQVVIQASRESGLRETTTFLCHQIRAIDNARLMIPKLGRLSQKELEEIATAIQYCLGIDLA